MRHRNLVFLIAALMLIAGLPVFAQGWAGRGRLQGEVRDEAGKPIEGAKIYLRMGDNAIDPENPGDGPAVLTTSKHGKWSVLGLAQGSWRVLIVKEGYMASEGQVKVNEGGAPPPPIVTKIRVAPKEVQQQQQAAAKNPAVALIEQGNQLLTQEKFAEARAAYEQALTTLDAEFHPPVLRGVARTYFQEKQADKAIQVLQQALTIKPDDVESLRLIVNLLVAQGKEAEAQQYIAKLPAGTGVDPATLLNIGIKHYNDGKMEDALREFNRVVEQNPTLADAYYYRALAYLGSNKTAEAVADFRKSIEVDANHSNAKEAKEFIAELTKK